MKRLSARSYVTGVAFGVAISPGPDESPSALLHSHHEEVPRVHPRLKLNHLPAHRNAQFPVVSIRVLNFVWQKISDMAEITKFREISAEIHF